MSSLGGGWMDRIVSACVGLLVASIALYCALAVLESIWPALITTIGVLAIIALVFGISIVVFRTWRDRW